MSSPFVAVFMVTYNQENYIGQAIESVIMQITSFPIKLFIGEDCSTDLTAAICKSFQEENPQIIEVLYNKKNIGAPKNAKQIFKACFTSGAKYIAMLEGDDYWIDPYKLQKQVDFLERNSEFVVSCHNAIVVDSQGNVLQNSKLPENSQRDFERDELVTGAFLLSVSLCFRNVISEFPPEMLKVLNGDTFLISMLGMHGKAKYQPEIKPSVYRRHSDGVWSSKSPGTKHKYQSKTFIYLYKFHKRIGTNQILLNKLFHSFLHYNNEVIDQYHENKKWSRKIYNTLTTFIICIKTGNIYKGLTLLKKFFLN